MITVVDTIAINQPLMCSPIVGIHLRDCRVTIIIHYRDRENYGQALIAGDAGILLKSWEMITHAAAIV